MISPIPGNKTSTAATVLPSSFLGKRLLRICSHFGNYLSFRPHIRYEAFLLIRSFIEQVITTNMKILSAAQIREVDAYTIQNEPIASIDLMERASRKFTNWFKQQFDDSNRICIVAGTGNNGGDGLAAGRMLVDANYDVAAFVVGKSEGSEDFLINLQRLSKDMEIPRIEDAGAFPSFNEYDIVIDAIFGSGLSRPVEGLYGRIIEKINGANAVKVSIDISSGLFCDQSSIDQITAKADYTYTFQLPKLAFLLPENDERVGEWILGDIGLDKDFIDRQVTDYVMVTRELLEPFVKKRPRHSHKGSFGKGLLVTGSYGKMGASVLASRAFMRSGAGLLTVMSPKCGYHILQSSVPEAMVLTSGEKLLEKNNEKLPTYDAIGLGPGLGTDPKTAELVAQLLQDSEDPLVIDADGLNILAKNTHLLGILPPKSILTPHPKEFERLVGSSKNNFDQLKRLKQFARKINGYIILKGAYTAVASPEGHIYFNSTGNPGMATAGSGDVLTGIVTSLLAQHQSPFHAAIFGTFIHGLAGDIAREAEGEEGLLASDIIRNIPRAFRSFH